MIRQAPPKLFDHLVAEGLGPLGVIGTQVDVHKAPTEGVGHLGAEFVDLVIVAPHRHQGGVVDQGAQYLAGLKISGDEDAALHAGMGRDGGGGVGQVAGAGTADGGEAQLTGTGEGNTHDPVLEGQGGHVDAVVLDVELFETQTACQTIGLQQRREACTDIDGITFDGQEVAVAPDRSGTGLDRSATGARTDGVVVVGDLKGTEADVFADVAGFGLVGVTTFPAPQAREGARGER